MAEPTFQTLGRYTIRAEIGRGGFATVYQALDTSLNREVALKVLHPQLLTDRSFVERFRKEARTLANLRHSNIVTLYEVSEVDGRLFIAMELAHGFSLARTIADRKRIPWADMLSILKPVSEALDYAHGQGVVHRDLKPANVLLDIERGPLLSDFGFARLLGDNSASMSLSGGILGTPAYIAPEVWELDTATSAADIYALGCIAYEMLTGEVLFVGKTPMQSMRAHDHGPQFPATWTDDVPLGVDRVLQVALARKPENRYPKATTLWHALNDMEANAQGVREQAERQAIADQWKAEVDTAMAEQEWSVAKMAVGRWLSITPDDPRAQAARAEIERQVQLESDRKKQAEMERVAQAALSADVARRAEEERTRHEADRKAQAETERKAREEQERQRQAEVTAQAEAAAKAKREAEEREQLRQAREAARLAEEARRKELAASIQATSQEHERPRQAVEANSQRSDADTLRSKTSSSPSAGKSSKMKWVYAVGAVIAVACIAILISNGTGPATPASQPAQVIVKPTEVATEVPMPVEVSAPTKAPTPTEAPKPTAVPSFPLAKDPKTWIYIVTGDLTTLDPSIVYETAGQGILQGNIYQQLINYDGTSVNKFVPTLAEAIPNPQFTQNGGVQYVWQIRDGIKWASGNPLTAEDVAFGLWRTMLIGDFSTPSFLLLEAFFNVDDASQIVIAPDGSLAGNPDQIRKSSATQLIETCQKVKTAVQFDNVSHTVTMNLPRAWGPLMATLAGLWASPQEKAWVASQGDWDGDCNTWQNFYGIPGESGKLRDQTNGTGPYKLEKWIPNEQISLVLNSNYNGSRPAIERVTIKNVPEFATRFSALQAGDADQIQTSSTDWAQMDTLVREECDYNTGDCKTVNPSGSLRVFKPLLPLSRLDIFFTFQVAEGSSYIGSGKLDGQGIPADFFSDLNVRKAFNYCFDRETYIKNVLQGEGTQSLALTLPGQPGYDGAPTYEFNLDKCASAFKASTLHGADGQSLWDTGFYLQWPYNEGHSARQLSAEILAANLKQVNSKFVLAPVSLPWPTFLKAQNAKQLPLERTGWQEDIHDPHNWYVPYLLGAFASRFNLPKDLQDKYKVLIDRGVNETDPTKRGEIYSELNRMVYDDAPFIILSFGNDRHYEPLYVKDWYGSTAANPLYSSPTGVWVLSKQ